MKLKLNTIVATCVASLILVGLTGCFVQSIHPFYTDAAKVQPPTVEGEWNFVRSGTEDLSTNQIKPWVFSAGDSTLFDVTVFSKQNVEAELKAVFFKVGDALFCDFTAGEVDTARINEYWVWNVRPVHTVYKVELKDDTMTIKPLSYEWFNKAVESKEVTLPFIKPAGKDDELALYTATPKDWEQFLKKHAGNKEAFPEKLALVLKKRKEAPKEPAAAK